MTLGQRLKKARKARGISQDILAEKIGASRGIITNLEYGKVEEPQPMVINAICNVLNINKAWLLEGEGPMNLDGCTDRSAKVLFEISNYAQDLSEEEQLFILDIIKTYIKHLK